MANPSYTYVIVGGGLAGASATEGIRERDKIESILLLASEKHLPYDRPPLSKKLWLGKKKIDDIFLHNKDFYDQNNITVALGATIKGLDVRNKTVTDDMGTCYGFKKLLLATGGIPRILSMQGGTMAGICYYRTLDDYVMIRRETTERKSAVIIGGGFIGSELAAALASNNIDVTMVFPSPYLAHRIFPEHLSQAIQKLYRSRGIKILAGEMPSGFVKNKSKFVTYTLGNKKIESDMVIVGIGIAPSLELARNAGLQTANGILVNEHLQTSFPDIYAAGDNAFFHYPALGKQVRIEHWDNALNQGKVAGRNMAGANESYSYMPYFFSDLFEFGYEAVGDVDASLETFTDWQKENETGVIYYLKDAKVRGAMMCNVWNKIETARELIRKAERVTPKKLLGAIR
ncbi:MAG TPA: FAD/NAD(P)-binding oxidoreductase [Nitrospirota bacterium]|nr:FAD/NAD(P)-binding oxidoreductase [Nitrospirota bacterium]